ncbi:MAG: hypothetical protein Q9201_007093 [Fulgogasparrea decipioides]
MSAPSSKTLVKLQGRWKLNKSLSADVASILALQGTSKMIRSAIGSASVTLTISQPSEEEYHVKQTATAAAIPGTTEQYILDNEWRTNKDPFFGEVKGRSRWISLDEGTEMQEDSDEKWEDSDEGKLILAESGSMDGIWESTRVWGFKELEGARRWIQSVHVWNKEGEDFRGNMVYDYDSED